MQPDFSKQIISSFAEIAKEKGIDRDLLLTILEDVFRTMIRKKYETDDAFSVILNADRGEIQILHVQEVVPSEELADPVGEISLEDAQKIDPDIELYDGLAQEVNILDVGRRAVNMARQQLAQRIREIEKDNIYEDYTDRVGEIILGDVYQVRHNKDILVNHNGVELLLPRNEQIYKDRYRKGDTIRAVVTGVHMKNGNPTVIISRNSELFLERLFENEIPEVFDGIIDLVKVARAPGDRSKVAVQSHDERIDPVGACVGMKGIRIHAIVRELQNENIDVINYTNNLQLYIQRALSTAKVTSLNIDEDNRRVEAFLAPDQVSLAIGRGGTNIRLASKLVDMEIDVYRDDIEIEDDIELDQFSDEIEGWIIDELKKIGCDTAKSVLKLTKEELVSRADLEEETVENIVSILKQEFEEE